LILSFFQSANSLMLSSRRLFCFHFLLYCIIHIRQIQIPRRRIFSSPKDREMDFLFNLPGGVPLYILPPFILPAFIYLRVAESTLQEISPINRKIKPGQVWWVLLPLYGFFYHFKVVLRLRDSLQAEAESQHLHLKNFTSVHYTGLAMCVLGILMLIPGLLILLAPALVCWVIFWIKTASYRKVLTESPP